MDTNERTPINDIFKQTLHAHLQENSKSEPYLACQFASKEILARLFSLIQDDKGVHVESMFVLLGSLAGHAISEYASTQSDDPHEKTRLINGQLFDNEVCLLTLINGILQQHNAPLCHADDIIAHVRTSVGRDDFGVPRLPSGHAIKYPPLACIKLWDTVKPILSDFLVTPDKWAVAMGLAIQAFITQSKNTLDPTLCAHLALECATAMSFLFYHQKFMANDL